MVSLYVSLSLCLDVSQISPDCIPVLLITFPDLAFVHTDRLNQFLGFEEAFQVLHLPNSSNDEDERLSNGPPEDTLVGALTRHTETLLAILKKKKKRPKGFLKGTFCSVCLSF